MFRHDDRGSDTDHARFRLINVGYARRRNSPAPEIWWRLLSARTDSKICRVLCRHRLDGRSCLLLAEGPLPELADKASLLLKVGFGIAVIVCSIAGYGYYLNHFLLLSFAPPFVWILLIGPSPRSGANSLSRTVIAFAAVLLTLQIFPIAGTQMAYGSFLIVIIGAACAYEGISDATSLTDWTSRRRVQLTASA
jgi:hypothetical protein